MILKTLCQTFIIICTVGVLASCGSSKSNKLQNGGQHVCSEARATQAGLADYLGKKDYQTDYATKNECPYDYQEINEAYHEGYAKGKSVSK